MDYDRNAQRKHLIHATTKHRHDPGFERIVVIPPVDLLARHRHVHQTGQNKNDHELGDVRP